MAEPRPVLLLDYGVGNLASVQRALEHAGARVTVSADVDDRSPILLPGVGAFGAAVDKLGARFGELQQVARAGRPLLGICLGMQLLFDQSHEHGVHRGLGLVPGTVEALPKDVVVPHMGWAATSGGDVVYFCHSFGVRPGPHTTSTVEHGGRWTAAVRKDSVAGFQFHPEKSGATGLSLLRGWVAGLPT
ncbi:MAG: imidazole glycerol phosphate synthase subunit HisH [Deltaproteobacteria bacterium]|nr:imidazole glycerol phosphate synthase subunit HisH [Deltaproteobacteria bacterium]